MSDIEREAQFLIERLRQFENENIDESAFRDWSGHVCPSIARLELLLQTARAQGDAEPYGCRHENTYKTGLGYIVCYQCQKNWHPDDELPDHLKHMRSSHE